jgi:hypothetical protein
MTVDELRQSLAQAAPPAGLDRALQALWYEAKGDWGRAHTLAQEEATPTGAWVHAYLHRVEGDPDNAAYWYRRAARPVSAASLADEWTEIATALLARG